jgi:hypothetical protein
MGYLIAYLLGIVTAFKSEHQKRTNFNNPSKTSQNQSLPNGPLSVVCIPPALSDKEAAEKEKEKGRKAIKFRAEMATLIVLGLYTTVTILIWCSTKEANRISRDTFISSNRPWIGVPEIKPSKETIGLSGTKFHIEWELPLVFKNYGHSPAQKVAYQANATTGSGGTMRHEWKPSNECGFLEEAIRGNPANATKTIFPGSDFTHADYPAKTEGDETALDPSHIFVIVRVIYKGLGEFHCTQVLYRGVPTKQFLPIPGMPSDKTYFPVDHFEVFDTDAD